MKELAKKNKKASIGITVEIVIKGPCSGSSSDFNLKTILHNPSSGDIANAYNNLVDELITLSEPSGEPDSSKAIKLTKNVTV